MSDRPITQHGLSGLPTAQARQGTANRLIKDKRYWQAQLQMKMNEITRETEKLTKERQTMDRERSAKRSFEKKVKEATKELTSTYEMLCNLEQPRANIVFIVLLYQLVSTYKEIIFRSSV